MKLIFKDMEKETQLIWLEYCVDNNSTCQDARAEFEYIFDCFVDTSALGYYDEDEILELGIWEIPKEYAILEHVTWEMYSDVFLHNDCVIDLFDKDIFLDGTISTEDYDEFIINKLLEAGYIEEAENE